MPICEYERGYEQSESKTSHTFKYIELTERSMIFSSLAREELRAPTHTSSYCGLGPYTCCTASDV